MVNSGFCHLTENVIIIIISNRHQYHYLYHFYHNDCDHVYYLLNRDMLEMWSGYGVDVVAWTVNHQKAKDFFMECLNCPIITDCVRHDSVWN